MYCIYKIINKENGKAYIGQTSNKPKRRFYEHIHEAVKENSSRYLCKAIRHYGQNNFELETLVWSPEKRIIDIMEKFYIRTLKTNDRDSGYNLTEGGEGTVGYKHTEEAKEKFSWKGRKHSTAARLKMSLAAKGHKVSDETKQKLSQYFKGKPVGPFSEEHRAKIGEANSRRIWTAKSRAKLSEAVKRANA